eukprot:1095957-Karenia_brevis.AAC.1
MFPSGEIGNRENTGELCPGHLEYEASNIHRGNLRQAHPCHLTVQDLRTKLPNHLPEHWWQKYFTITLQGRRSVPDPV